MIIVFGQICFLIGLYVFESQFPAILLLAGGAAQLLIEMSILARSFLICFLIALIFARPEHCLSRFWIRLQ